MVIFHSYVKLPEGIVIGAIYYAIIVSVYCCYSYPCWWYVSTPLKNMSSPVGMIKFPIYGKIRKTCAHIYIYIYIRMIMHIESCRYYMCIYVYIINSDWWYVSTPLKHRTV